MFKIKRKTGQIRSGSLEIGNKKTETPCFFATSDFGGGGTNVSRLLVYSDLFRNSKSQLLMNYYYLDINSDSTPRFDTNLIRILSEFKNINSFIQYVKKEYLESASKKAIKNYKYEKETVWLPIILLDSGSGNILRGKIKGGELTTENYKNKYKKLIDDYFSFSISNKFDIIIAMDFAGKNTLKAGEMKDKEYVSNVVKFSGNEYNFELLRLTLDYMKENKTTINVLAPIHGNNPREYEEYIKKILSMERKEKISFSGFAIGGLGNPNQINKKVWDIPDNVNGKIKAALYLLKISSIIRNILNENSDDRTIHILGSASHYNLIPLIYSGCDTFDCHSAWRRASDGNQISKECVFDESKIKEHETAGENISFSKVLVSLLDSNLNVITENKNKFLEFVNINKYDFKCDCFVCNNIGFDVVKKLYCGNTEENYYAKILIYLHNIIQYDFICERMRVFKDERSFKEFIESIPECQFKKNMIDILFPE
ncbi:MAG: hypothetical protein ABIJ92_04905 [Candidatus Aenigmatarchaeota archaeon]